jgi:hypothetical protein
MSYQVRQRIRGKIYVYEAEGFWDKEKRQARQKRRYLGVLNEATGEIENPRKEKWGKRTSLTSGVIHAAEKCSVENGLMELLEESFGGCDGEKIFALAAYCATENAPMCLYENWAHMTDGLEDCAMTSQTVSRFLRGLGENEAAREGFWRLWGARHGQNRNLVFDITSVSTYAAGLVLDEFGYNRDGERLPQVNIGMLFADRPGRPLGYRVYPGGISDVATLKNLLRQMKSDYALTHSRLVMDRGFYSAANVKSLYDAGYDFILPLPLRRFVNPVTPGFRRHVSRLRGDFFQGRARPRTSSSLILVLWSDSNCLPTPRLAWYVGSETEIRTPFVTTGAVRFKT